MPSRSEPEILADLIRLHTRLEREDKALEVNTAADAELIEQARAALHRYVGHAANQRPCPSRCSPYGPAFASLQAHFGGCSACARLPAMVSGSSPPPSWSAPPSSSTASTSEEPTFDPARPGTHRARL